MTPTDSKIQIQILVGLRRSLHTHDSRARGAFPPFLPPSQECSTSTRRVVPGYLESRIWIDSSIMLLLQPSSLPELSGASDRASPVPAPFSRSNQGWMEKKKAEEIYMRSTEIARGVDATQVITVLRKTTATPQKRLSISNQHGG